MKKAHTLVESIMVVVLVGIISFVFSLYIQEGFNAWKFISGQKSIALSSRAALNRMVREIKRAQEGSISAALDDTFSFQDNVSGQTITFDQKGTDLRRNDDVLLSNLSGTGLDFTYLDADGKVPATNNDIRVVIIKLTVAKDENMFVIESAARIRNRTL